MEGSFPPNPPVDETLKRCGTEEMWHTRGVTPRGLYVWHILSQKGCDSKRCDVAQKECVSDVAQKRHGSEARRGVAQWV